MGVVVADLPALVVLDAAPERVTTVEFAGRADVRCPLNGRDDLCKVRIRVHGRGALLLEAGSVAALLRACDGRVCYAEALADTLLALVVAATLPEYAEVRVRHATEGVRLTVLAAYP